MKTNKELKQLFDQFNEKPIVYNRVYSKITGSVTAGLLLSQLVYWAKTMDYKEFYKTDKEFSEELGMGLYELRGAKKKLKELKLVNIEVKNVPAKTYYKVDVDEIIALISSLGKNHKLDCGKTTNWNEEKPQTITENTTENTTENKNIAKQSFAGKEVNEILEIFYEYNPMINFGNKTQRKAVEELIKKFGIEAVKETCKYALSIQKEQYAPRITTPIQLKNKMGDLRAYFEKNKSSNRIVNL
jgi:hypothetical protein